MKANQLKKVVENHKKYIDLSCRAKVEYTCQFIEDLLKEELKYLKETEPQAVASIVELEKGIEAVKSLYFTIDDIETSEIVKERIWS